MNQHIHILVVEDEPDIQTLIRLNLQRAGFTHIESAYTLAEAQTYLTNKVPDVVLLDWMLPDGSGVEWIRKIRTENRTQELPIILLTAKSEESDKVKGLEAGSDDYITKPFSPNEMLARIRSLLRRRAPQLSDQAITIGEITILPQLHQLQIKGTVLSISPTEFKVLMFFATHSERVYTRTQLLNAIWGDHVFIEERTIDVHIRRLRNILKPYGYENIIETVRGAGYRLTLEHTSNPAEN